MRTRSLGRTGLEVSELSLGTWGLSGDGYGASSADEVERTLHRALDLGITLFETADSYGGGAMEATLGKALPKDVAVATRVGIDLRTDPPQKRFSPEFLRARVDASLARLKREAIDLCMLHGPSLSALNESEVAATMAALKQEGKIRAWGVSADRRHVAREALSRGAEVIELPYNLGHPGEVEALAGDLLVAHAGLLVRSILGYGVLSGTLNEDRNFAEGDHRRERYTRMELEARLQLTDRLRVLVRGELRTLRAVAVRFALANTTVSSAVLGPRNEAQLIELVREAGAGPRYLSDAVVREVFSILEREGVAL